MARWFLVIAGGMLLLHTLFGLFAILGVSIYSIENLGTALCLTLAFPIYLLGLKSLRVATSVLWLFFGAQWADECLLSRPQRFANPLDWPYGDTLFIAVVLVHLGYLQLSRASDKHKPVRITEAFNPKRLRSTVPEDWHADEQSK